jgi:acyl carrier protein
LAAKVNDSVDQPGGQGGMDTSAMTDDQIVAQIAGLIRKCVPDAQAVAISVDSRLVEDIGIDSLGAYELIMEAEDLFHIEITDSQVEGIKTIADLIAIVRGPVVQVPNA